MNWLKSFDEDFYIGVVWKGNKWVYASDNSDLVSGVADWKSGKDEGEGYKTCVKFKYKGSVRSLEVIKVDLRSIKYYFDSFFKILSL